MDSQDLLMAYDQQLRTDAETAGAVVVTHLGLLHLATFAGGRGLVTYPQPRGADAIEMPHLVSQVLDYYRSDPTITQVEWRLELMIRFLDSMTPCNKTGSGPTSRNQSWWERLNCWMLGFHSPPGSPYAV